MDLHVERTPIKYNIWYSLSDLSLLHILWDSDDSKYYTLVIHNVDTKFVNGMMINIPGNEITKGTQVVPFVSPNPPNGQYIYRITVFQQPSVIIHTKQSLSWFQSSFDFDSLLQRSTIEVAQFIKYYGLALISNETLVVDGNAKLYYRSRDSEVKELQKEFATIDINFETLGIGGLNEQLTDLVRDVIGCRFMSKERQDRYGVRDVKGILLYGPPGTGKTLIARNIGKLIPNSVITKVNGPELSDSWFGETEANIRKLFVDTYKYRNKIHVIIFDEIDAIGRRRSSDPSAQTDDKILTQLLTMIDGLDSTKNILVIGITNRKDILDPALLRSGRLEYHLEIPLPDEAARKQILNIYLRPLKAEDLVGDVDIDGWAKRLEGYSGADIENLVNKAKKIALLRNLKFKGQSISSIPPTLGQNVSSVIGNEDFEVAFVSVKPVPTTNNSDDIVSRLSNMLQNIR